VIEEAASEMLCRNYSAWSILQHSDRDQSGHTRWCARGYGEVTENGGSWCVSVNVAFAPSFAAESARMSDRKPRFQKMGFTKISFDSSESEKLKASHARDTIATSNWKASAAAGSLSIADRPASQGVWKRHIDLLSSN
jgi:hypothetical protein